MVTTHTITVTGVATVTDGTCSLYDDLLVYWPMDEAAGNNRVNAMATNVGDLTEAGGGTVANNTGNVYATAADWPSDGSEADYLSLANANKGLLSSSIGAAVSRTIAFWMYMYDGSDTAGQYHAIWENGGDAFTGGESMWINQADQVWSTWGDGAGTGSAACHGPAAVLNSWELWICQQDAAADEITIYKWPSTGVEEQNEIQDYAVGQAANTGAISICAPDTNGNAKHRLGPLMIWGRLLTSAERSALWNDGDGWEV